MRKLAITNNAAKALAELPAKQYKQVATAIFSLLRDPTPHDSLLLHGAKHGERRVDTGEYRVIYHLADENTLEVLVIGKRNDDEVYRQWLRTR